MTKTKAELNEAAKMRMQGRRKLLAEGADEQALKEHREADAERKREARLQIKEHGVTEAKRRKLYHERD